jgi:hypothetical protein
MSKGMGGRSCHCRHHSTEGHRAVAGSSIQRRGGHLSVHWQIGLSLEVSGQHSKEGHGCPLAKTGNCQ